MHCSTAATRWSSLDNLTTGRKTNLEPRDRERREAGRRGHPRRRSGGVPAGGREARGGLPPRGSDRRARVGRAAFVRRRGERARARSTCSRPRAGAARAGSCTRRPAARSTARPTSCRRPRERRSAPRRPTARPSTPARDTCRCGRRLHGLSTVSLRFGNVYGPRQDPLGEAGVIAIFCGKLETGGAADGVRRRAPDARLRVRRRRRARVHDRRRTPTRHGAYNVGRGEEVSVLDLVEQLGMLGDELGLLNGAHVRAAVRARPPGRGAAQRARPDALSRGARLRGRGRPRGRPAPHVAVGHPGSARRLRRRSRMPARRRLPAGRLWRVNASSGSICHGSSPGSARSQRRASRWPMRISSSMNSRSKNR